MESIWLYVIFLREIDVVNWRRSIFGSKLIFGKLNFNTCDKIENQFTYYLIVLW
jgi:hypothetical protein